MKKWIVILLTLCLVFSAVACTAKPAESKADTYEIAMVTDIGNIDDQSFNQFTYEGAKKFAEDNGKTFNYYRPSEDSDDARIESIETAIAKGAKVVVCPGYLFGAAFKAVPAKYPDVTFVGIDMTTADVPEPQANTVLVAYQEEQAGYFAGYATVKAGYTKLAFLGGIDVPAVVRYGHGFVLGADAAAAELGNAADVNVKYWYSGSFAPNDEIKTKTAGWYTEGTEVIFACGGGIVYSAIASAEETAEGKIVGVDVDQGYINERIITSAMKDLSGAVQAILKSVYDNGGKLPAEYAGKDVKLGATTDSVGIPTAEASWKLGDFTVEEYNALFAKVKSGEITISDAIDVHPEVAITVDYQN